MPNWCDNNCDFNMSLKELLDLNILIDVTDYSNPKYLKGYYDLRFNLHTLFPDYFVDEYLEYKLLPYNKNGNNKISTRDFLIDNTFDNKWNYDWYVENLGCKWDVSIELFCSNPESRNLSFFFESPRAPPIGIFKALADIGIGFSNEYEEPGAGFQGVCESQPGQGFMDHQEDYVPLCNSCDQKIEGVEYCEELGEDICPDCLSDEGSTCCGASIDNGLCSDCKEHNEGYTYEE